MHILLFVPDNHVTRNFVPQLWPFLLRARTPAGHRVTIIDGNAQRLTIPELVQYIKDHDVDLLGMGFMTRMAQRAYDTALAVRAATKVPIVFGGPHVTALPDEAARTHRAPPDGRLRRARRGRRHLARGGRRRGARRAEGGLRPRRARREARARAYTAIDWESLDLGLFDLMRFVPERDSRLAQADRNPVREGVRGPGRDRARLRLRV